MVLPRPLGRRTRLYDSCSEVFSIAIFGDKLRLERERQGHSLAYVAQETKIRQQYLAALENEDFDSLPARVYAVGFVASYARFLKLDADKLVNEFKNIAYNNETTDIRLPEPPAEGKIFGFPVRNVLTATIFLALAIWLGNYVAGYISQHGVKEPPAIEQPSSPSIPENTTPVNQLTLGIEAKQRSWLQVTVDGKIQYAGIMEAGEKQFFSAQDKIELRTGNAGGIDLVLNGTPVDSIGGSGQVAERTFTRNSANTNDQTVPAVSPAASDSVGLNLVVQAQQKSWVQVKADGQVVYSMTMTEGELQSFMAKETIELFTGNAGGITLLLNNQPVEPLGSSGQIAEKTFSANE